MSSDHHHSLPVRQGLYDPTHERDACGVGFIANLKGRASHDVVEKAIEILVNLTHRGATGADADTGDGAGILLQIPDDFLRDALGDAVTLPPPGEYAAGSLFLAQERQVRARQEEVLEETARELGLEVLGWRTVPTNPDEIGPTAHAGLPVVRQVFLTRPADVEAGAAFERRLLLTRRTAENRVNALGEEGAARFHIASLSSRTMVYKGLLLAHQIERFYPELTHPEMKSALAIVHQRYSTNTFPTWRLAQPFRYLAHNGEINTLRGNVNWMRAREKSLGSPDFGDGITNLFPILTPGASDSAQFDGMLELLLASGRSLAHAICMLIPEAWEHNEAMDPARRAFFAYHANLMEPWDGPAAIAFTDGNQIGAVLDRNGLRPARYVVTRRGHVVMASEVGVLDVPPEEVELKGRLQPGRIFLVDMSQGRIVTDEEIKEELTSRRPYAQWLAEQQVALSALPDREPMARPTALTLQERQKMFGYTTESLKVLMAPMINEGREAIGSMGDDTALACLSDRHRLLYEYFKQLFAQVTNPAIDSIRERSVMSLSNSLGPERNLLAETPEHARVVRVDHPLLTSAELEKLRQIDEAGLKARTLPMLFRTGSGGDGLRDSLRALRDSATRAVESGVNLLILSDRGACREMVPIPALLALSGVHHHLIREGVRTRCSIVVETGEAREIAHFALLLGYGASAINPYLAFETIRDMVRDGAYTHKELTKEKARANFFKAVSKGLLKIFAKMGISTLQSYQGAQLFEAIGLSREVVDEWFEGTPSRIDGVTLDVLAQETQIRHELAFPAVDLGIYELEPGGMYQWRRRGERHAFNPDVVARLQHAVRSKTYATYREFSDLVNDQAEQLCTLRGLLSFQFADEPLPLEEVEPASAIVKRFCTGAMSFGSISKEAHETLAVAMNALGGRSNTGEGGEDPERFTPDPDGALRRSAIKQVASGRFGVTSWYLTNADEIQIKIAQGAKPGEGGQLPGHKVNSEIARIRHSTPGVGLISPPPHHDIYSIEDLAQLIYDLKNANDQAGVSVKLVSETGVGTVAAGVSKGKADGVVISGHDGGTGASPQTSLKYAGVPWEIGLAETQQTLVLNNLRGRIKVQVDGGLKTGRDVVIGALLGADEFGFSTAPLVAMGCILMRVCHLNTCPVGIATQDPELRGKFNGLPEHVIRYFFFVADEVRELMAKLGFRTMDEMIGRVDKLSPHHALDHWKAQGVSLEELLHAPDVPYDIRWTTRQVHDLDGALDHELIERAKPALERGERVAFEVPVRNVHRTVGTMLGSRVSRRYGEAGLPDDTIQITFKGTAGQSFGAFVPRGMTMTIEGDANDYVGKGLSGGRIVVKAPPEASYDPSASIIAGNVLLYGATGGEAYFGGLVGERFCVRNSGAWAVAEGVGDHGCEYMTGGRAVILGPTGRNFAAGMSGGIAYILDEDGRFEERCNLGMVALEELEDDDVEVLRTLIERHLEYTGSARARELLADWEATLARFVKVMPVDYRRVLDEQRDRAA